MDNERAARPELGGRPDYVDIVGVNYYLHNQWLDGDLPVAVDHADSCPLSRTKLEISMAAPASSTTDNPTCAATKPRRKRC